MPGTLEEELDAISELHNAKTVHDRRSARKGAITRLDNYITSIGPLMLYGHHAAEIQKKLEELHRSRALFEALQEKYEELSEDKPDFDLAQEQQQAAEFQATVDNIQDLFEEKYAIANQYDKGSYLEEQLENYDLPEKGDASIILADFKRLQDAFDTYLSKTARFKGDRGIAEQRDKVKRILNARRKEIFAITPNKKEASTPAVSATATTLKTELPTFSGNPTEWSGFFTLFNSVISKDTSLTDAEKCCLLTKAMKSTEAHGIAIRASENADYSHLVSVLQAKYNQKRTIYTAHVKALLSQKKIPYRKKEMEEASEKWLHHAQGLERAGGYTLQQFLGALLIENFDETLGQHWCVHTEGHKDPPTIEMVIDFLQLRSISLQSDLHYKATPCTNSGSSNKHSSSKPGRVLATRGDSPKDSCPSCKGEHRLFRCSDFGGWDVDRRSQFVRQQYLCFNCLSPAHSVRQCPSKRTCNTCGRKHHTMLHKTEDPVPTNGTPPPGGQALTASSHSTGFLTTAMMKVSSGDYSRHARAILDTAATISLINSSLARTIRAKRHLCELEINGKAKSKSYITVQLRSLHPATQIDGEDDYLEVDLYVVDEVMAPLPRRDMSAVRNLDVVRQNKPLADTTLGSYGTVDLLLGTNAVGPAYRGVTLQSPGGFVTVTWTLFGWTVGGTMPSTPAAPSVMKATPTVFKIIENRTSTDSLLQQLWQQESIREDQNNLTEEEKLVEDHFKDTTRRSEDGRYIVELPRIPDPPQLGESRAAAVRCFTQNKKSLQKKGQWETFSSVMKEYGQLHHAEVVPESELSKPASQTYYLPAHGILKQDSTTTKVRAVFDASASTTTGVSLNNTLLPGPSLFPPLTSVLNKFRQHQVAICGDVSKMFREILLADTDKDYHRFIWDDEWERIQDWRMLRLTFGVASSPFLAVRVLRQIAEDYKAEYPELFTVVNKSFYVDDVLTGSDSPREAAELRRRLCDLLSLGGMMLRKWRSNSKEVLHTIPEELRETTTLLIRDNVNSHPKTLGVHWDSATDTFHLAVPDIHHLQHPTKREVASSVARLYDSLGWFAPVTLQVKLLLQILWRRSTDWDTTILEDLLDRWKDWQSSLPSIADHAIPRRYHQQSTQPISIQLHGYCDASQDAYGAVVYIRLLHPDSTITVSLVTAKTRVGPVKKLTIPRMELNGALLLARLLKTAAEDLEIPLPSIYAWSDSTIALGWISNVHSKWTVYVSNRVKEIREFIPHKQWRYVPTGENPADIASRGMSPRQLISSELWWKGPPWLSRPPDSWPTHPSPTSVVLPEARIYMYIARVKKPPDDLTALWSRYSSHNHLLRVITWMKRFCYNSRHPDSKLLQPALQSDELENTRTMLLKLTQKELFPEELCCLRKGEGVHPNSKLLSLSPLLDDRGLIRVGGRLELSGESYNTKHPVILHSNHPFVKLLVRQIHLDNCHPGPSTLLSVIAHSYYLIAGKKLCKSICQKCVPCKKAYVRTAQQQMGQLPSSRTQLTPPFMVCGVDFAGPFYTKEGNQRKPTIRKNYVCVFICFCTHAIHLERAVDLSTATFLAALSRFANRRGCPKHIYSDHGRNFVGAARELKEVYEVLESESFQNTASHFCHSSPSQMAFYPSKSASFWRFMGICCEAHEG